ncbi:YjcZ family sporulation protein [Salimicrobium halophilum]|uniref:Conserved hypothetical tiny transmembrane protein n=1 Tax=Salimicrobium halophilum TaxID=86666 RepID=A0A1G8RPU4_9BACI|nr:YjcZ family sporulation protein [Salimicrobium halophilum]SDJ18420.1 conserved hypothetical tiny transmembrane protein [Salimicrobium halophilum]
MGYKMPYGGYEDDCDYNHGGGGTTFILIVVLFILLVIVGASWY